MDKKKIKKFIMHNQMNLLIGGISILALIIGTFAIGFFKSFLIIGIIDLLLFAPNLIKMIQKKKNKKPSTKSEKKENQSKQAEHAPKKEKNPKKSAKKKKRKKIFKWILISLIILFVLIMIAASIFVGLFFKQIADEAPEFDPHKLDFQESSVFYFANGDVITKVGAEKREKITYDQLPEVLINAIVATEDSRYFVHNGFDLPRFLKASAQQVLGKLGIGSGGGGGASTLTMQVSKNNYTSTESEGWEGIKRKFTDIYMAIFQLEKTYTKEQILEFYINDNYLGGGSYGVEQASLTYFGKHAKDLNLSEAAMIAGLFQSPGGYDPYLFPDACESRRKTVLYLMERHGYITSEERAIANKMTVQKLLNHSRESTEESDINNDYMGFINTVIAEIQTDTGLDPYSTPMKIYTTLNKEKQDEINKILTGETYNWKNPAVDMGAALVDTHTGEILAVSTGRHNMYKAKVLNYATIKHQIGSTSKPLFDYGPAIEYLNWGTGEPIVDEKYSYTNGGNVNNWDLKYMGKMTITDALRMSRNIPAIKTFQKVPSSEIQRFVTNLNMHPEAGMHEAHAIGGYAGESPIDMAAAYAAFANGGYYITPHSYTKIELRDTGEVIEKKVEKSRAMSEETAYMVMSMLQETKTYALGNYSNISGVTFGAKTGTTNYPDSAFSLYNLPSGSVNDLWVVGTSPTYALSVWYGYDSIKPENVEAGYINRYNTIEHTRLFQTLGKVLFEQGTGFTRPNGVVEVSVEKETYPVLLPSPNTPADMITTALYKKGTEPTEMSTRFMQLSDVTDLKGTVSGNKVTLSWSPIKAPDAFTEEGLRNMWQPLFATEDAFAEYIGAQLAYNNSVLGILEYHIYRKNSNGELTYIDKTSDSKITFTDKSGGRNTYVVKASYSIFTTAASNGTDVTVTVDSTGNGDDDDEKPTKNISILLNNGNNNIKISEDHPFDETGLSYITVTELSNGILVDVSRQANTTISHESFDYTQIGKTYLVTLKVSYKDVSKVITLNATIEEKKEG